MLKRILAIAVGDSRPLVGHVVHRQGVRGPWIVLGRGATLDFTHAWQAAAFLNASVQANLAGP